MKLIEIDTISIADYDLLPCIMNYQKLGYFLNVKPKKIKETLFSPTAKMGYEVIILKEVKE